jgi:hypothetical protein
MDLRSLHSGFLSAQPPTAFKFGVNCEFLKDREKCKDFFILESEKSPVGLNNHDDLIWFLKLQFKTDDIEILDYQVKIL